MQTYNILFKEQAFCRQLVNDADKNLEVIHRKHCDQVRTSPHLFRDIGQHNQTDSIKAWVVARKPKSTVFLSECCCANFALK